MNSEISNRFRACYEAAEEHSDDPRTKLGAMVVVPIERINSRDLLDAIGCSGVPTERQVVGVNHLPNGFKITPERLETPAKYENIIHAEEDAIFRCCYNGYRTHGLIMVAPWACCKRCARAIVSAGLRGLITHQECMDRCPDHWKQSVDEGLAMLAECGVKHKSVSGKIGGVKHLMNGEIWYP